MGLPQPHRSLAVSAEDLSVLVGVLPVHSVLGPTP
jgi:hypothetical protein